MPTNCVRPWRQRAQAMIAARSGPIIVRHTVEDDLVNLPLVDPLERNAEVGRDTDEQFEARHGDGAAAHGRRAT